MFGLKQILNSSMECTAQLCWSGYEKCSSRDFCTKLLCLRSKRTWSVGWKDQMSATDSKLLPCVTFNHIPPVGVSTSIVTSLSVTLKKQQQKNNKKMNLPMILFCNRARYHYFVSCDLLKVLHCRQKALGCSQMLTSLNAFKVLYFHVSNSNCKLTYIAPTCKWLFYTFSLFVSALVVFFILWNHFISQNFTFCITFVKLKLDSSPWKSFCSDLVCCNMENKS